jgi:hypothetical protein
MKSTSLARASFNAACLLLLATAPNQAQDAVAASLRFVNATGADLPLTVRVNGALLQPRGYRSGEATGRLEITSGPCHIELSQPQYGRLNLTLNLQTGDTRTVVALIQPPRDEADRRRPPKLACHVLETLPPCPPRQLRLRVLQTTPLAELRLRLAGLDLHCPRLQTQILTLTQPNPAIQHAGQPLGRLPFEEAGDGTLILFADQAGHLRRVFFLEPVGAREPADRE